PGLSRLGTAIGGSVPRSRWIAYLIVGVIRMCFRIATVLLITLALYLRAGFGASNAAGSMEAALAKIDQAATGFRSLQTDVKKVSHTAVTNEDTIDIGTLYVKRPKPRDLRMLFDIKQPD